ncbi:MAG: thiamine-phosphate kinase [Candidatus Omnitrophota bacterium]
MKTLHDIGEFGMIERFAKQVHSGRDIVRGIGDDAAVIDIGTEEYLLMTTDMLVEGLHFLRTIVSAQEIGRKALACSISDIAAMGGTPTYAVVSLGAPSNITVQLIEGIGEGINRLAKDFGVKVVGGDTVRNARVVINVALLGKVRKDEVVYRNGARKGDIIFVSGSLGNSFRTRKHIHFKPMVEEARFLVKNAKPTSMMDVSDGLAGDLGHILKQSGVGALLYEDKIPLAQGAGVHQALHDGEDFELLFTVNPKDADNVRRSQKFKFYEVGKIVPGNSLMLSDARGKKRKIEMKGFEHF